MNYIKSKTELQIGNIVIDLKHTIFEVLEIKGLIAVILFDKISDGSVKIKDQPRNNVSMFDENGKIVWNIRDIIPEDVLYTNIEVSEDSNLKLTDFHGRTYTIEPVTNNIINRGCTK